MRLAHSEERLTLYEGDARQMSDIPDNSVALIVTSPPYWNGRDYSHWDTYEAYLEDMWLAWKECKRVLVDTGRICINIPPDYGFGESRKHFTLDIGEQVRTLFSFWGNIVWNKCIGQGTELIVRDRRTGSVSQRTVYSLHEDDGWRNVDVEALDSQMRPCWKPIVNLWRTEPKDGLRLTFRDGSVLVLTGNHRLAKIDGTLVLASTLSVGDKIRRSAVLPEYTGTIPDAMASSDLAWALGLYLAEGSLGRRTKKGIQNIKYSLNEEKAITFIPRLRAAWEPFGCHISTSQGHGKKVVAVTVSGYVAYAILQTFVRGDGATNKAIMDTVLSAPEPWRRAFLTGYLAGDGLYEKSATRWLGNNSMNKPMMASMRTLARSLHMRLHTKNISVRAFGKKHPAIKWHLYEKESEHPNGLPWNELEVVRTEKFSSTFYDLALSDEPHLFVLANGIVSHNSATGSSTTAWGSWKSSSRPNFRGRYELILVASKGEYKRATRGVSDITAAEFTEYSQNLWSFPGVSGKKRTHPAPFPATLPYRCIKMLSYVGETVLDPFSGSGTTALVARDTGRVGIGVELHAPYIEETIARIAPRGVEKVAIPLGVSHGTHAIPAGVSG